MSKLEILKFLQVDYYYPPPNANTDPKPTILPLAGRKFGTLIAVGSKDNTWSVLLAIPDLVDFMISIAYKILKPVQQEVESLTTCRMHE